MSTFIKKEPFNTQYIIDAMKNKYFISSFLLLTFFFFIRVNAQRPEESEVWEPVPEVVTPGEGNLPPSDAVVLFDGKDLSQWEASNGNDASWNVHDKIMTIVPKSGSIRTKRSFGDCQLHIEWRTPEKVEGNGQGRGNSGIFLMGKYELQVLDSYNNVTYSNGQAGSIYKQHIPLVNACKAPGEWQSYDIIFTAPRFNEDGTVKKAARITVLQNGVLIQNNVKIEGGTVFAGKPVYEKHPEKLPLLLQDHNNPVSYRNIWIREL